MVDNICNFFIKYHQKFIKLFFFLYFFLIILVISSFYFPVISRFSKLSGQISLSIYILTLVPGITKRFSLRHLVFNVLQIYRRQLGISMFIFTLVHLVLSIYFPVAIFMQVGIIATIILFFLFLTSNNFSVTHLSKNWFLLQRFTYLAMFFIFLHVSLINFGNFSLLLFFVIILEIISFLFPLLSKRG